MNVDHRLSSLSRVTTAIIILTPAEHRRHHYSRDANDELYQNISGDSEDVVVFSAAVLLLSGISLS